MILAGGQGSRLGALTKNIAKPAVPFGGKYRIIDFPLSNCANSGIEKVGVLTQYRPLELHNYLASGSSWDLDTKDGGVFILPPYAREKGADWYRGTADAIYQNLNFIDLADPEYVLILSGDHIYTMDYSWMLEAHKKNKADATIGVIQVPWEEAPRFGIMNTDKTGRIEEFEEKPAKPKSNLASMGIYVFNKSFLKKYLEDDAKDETSSHDFGKNIIPKMLADKARLFSYAFEGYWKDVGTIESLWQAKMDLIPYNPADKVERPKKQKYIADYYRLEELEQLFEATKDHPYSLLIQITAFYGLRRSEALGLRWDAIDFERNTITIRHIVTNAKIDGKYEIIREDCSLQPSATWASATAITS